MQLEEHKYETELGARFDALVVTAEGGELGEGAALAVQLAGGRIVARLGWHDALDRISAVGGRPVLVLDAREAASEFLAGALSWLDGLAVGRDLRIVIGIEETQIDLVAVSFILSRPEILCAPSAGDWVQALALCSAAEPLSLHDVRGESEAERLNRLNAEVTRIADVLSRLSRDEGRRGIANVAEEVRGFGVQPADEPDVSPNEIRQIVRARRLRDRHIGGALFEDPAWDMMLDLYAAHLEKAQVSVSSLCIAAAVAPTTALRWIARMTDAGLFERKPDPFDRRRAFMSLTERGLDAMRRYVASVQTMNLPLV